MKKHPGSIEQDEPILFTIEDIPFRIYQKERVGTFTAPAIGGIGKGYELVIWYVYKGDDKPDSVEGYDYTFQIIRHGKIWRATQIPNDPPMNWQQAAQKCVQWASQFFMYPVQDENG